MLRHVVTTLSNTLPNSLNRKFGRTDPNVEHTDDVASSGKRLQPSRVRSARERRLKPKASSFAGEFAETPHHEAAGLKIDSFGIVGGEPGGKHIGVDELIHPESVAQQPRGAC